MNIGVENLAGIEERPKIPGQKISSRDSRAETAQPEVVLGVALKRGVEERLVLENRTAQASSVIPSTGFRLW